MKENQEEEVKKPKAPKKAGFEFIRNFTTQKNEYKKGDDCFETDELVTFYLLKNKIIKPKNK